MNNDNKRLSQLERIELHRRVLEKRSGKAVRTFNQDGYVNVLNKYGTSKDTSEHYHYQAEPAVPDDVLSMHYESNGLFAKIIDAPAEESVKHGFELEGISDPDTQTFFREAYDTLDLDNIFVTGNKWARLFGGAIGVIIADDGRGIDEPLDWKNIKSVEEVRIYDRSLIQPDYHSMFSYSPEDPYMTRGQKFGMPERYAVFSKYGTFTVHESRCLIFRNGILPEKCTNSVYQFWGMPEYMRLKRSMRDTELAYGSGPKMLDRSVQAIYKMKGLSQILSAEGGDDIVLKRLEVIDMARGMLNSITIDSEGEDYDFKQFQFSGVAEIIDRSCAYLSALSNIPQSILFGAGAGGLSTTDDTSMENWYNFVERIQRNNNKSNLRYLLSIIAQAGVYTGELQEVPPIKIKFNPLWSQSETEKVDIEQKRAAVQSTKAQTAAAYVQMGAIDPSEVRRKLADDEEFNVETILDDLDENDLLAAVEGAVNEETEKTADELGGNSPDADPAATKSEEELNGKDLEQMAEAKQNADDKDDDTTRGVGVLVVKDGKVLVGVRLNDFGGGLLCGPGGHAKIGETSEDAAIRETQEEFGITPTNLVFIGTGPREVDTGIASDIFLCTEYEGDVVTDKVEMAHPAFVTLDEIEEMKASLFQPFADSIKILNEVIKPDPDNNDGGPGSGFHNHEGRKGKQGGSSSSGSIEAGDIDTSSTSFNYIRGNGTGVTGGWGMKAESKEYQRSKGDSEETIKEIDKLFHGHNSGGEAQADADKSIESHMEENDAVGVALTHRAEFETACYEEWKKSHPDSKQLDKNGELRVFRKGDRKEGVECWTIYEDGANMGQGGIGIDHSSTLEQLQREGYSVIAGFATMGGAPGEGEITFVKTGKGEEMPSEASNTPKPYSFSSMSDDDKAAYMREIGKTKTDAKYNSEYHKFLSLSGISGEKPDVVSAEEFDKIDSPEMFRTVNSYDDISAKSQIDELVEGEQTPLSWKSSSNYGVGVYFDENKRESTKYGSSDNPEDTITVSSKLKPGSKIVDFDELEGMVSKEMESGSKLGRRMENYSKESQVSLYALACGYDAIKSGTTVAALHRNCLVFKEQKKTNTDSADEINSIISEKPIDKSAKTDIIKSKDTQEDGAPFGNTNASKDHYLKEATAEDLKRAEESGKIKMSMNASKQSKHRKGTDAYNKAVDNGDFVSTLDISDEELDAIVREKSGTGKVYMRRDGGHIKESFDCGKHIGTYAALNGKEYPTTRLTVHHSKKGWHALPASSGGKKE